MKLIIVFANLTGLVFHLFLKPYGVPFLVCINDTNTAAIVNGIKALKSHIL